MNRFEASEEMLSNSRRLVRELQAENKRLREALSSIKIAATTAPYSQNVDFIAATAEQALKGDKS